MEAFSTLPRSMSRGDFLAVFGGVYEHSQWVAEQAYEAGLGVATDRPEGLSERMHEFVLAAGHDPQLVLLRAHPDLAGKLAARGELTAESTREQAGAGLDQCSNEEFAEFTKLNDRYKEKFGFPFIIAVTGLDRAAILDQFRKRVDNDMATEFATAIDEVRKIALIRMGVIAQNG